MNDFEMYASGAMNLDEQEQWDHVSQMMAECGEHDGYGPAQAAYDASQGDPDGDHGATCDCDDDDSEIVF